MSTAHRTGERIHIKRTRVVNDKWFAEVVEVLPMRGPYGNIIRKPTGWAVVGISPADAYNKLRRGM